LDQQCNEYCTHDKRCNSLGWSFSSFGRDIILQATDIDVALLYVWCYISGLELIGGWASNNKFSLIGPYELHHRW
jgi:NADH:ubiquinone oxidoreductase subunit H